MIAKKFSAHATSLLALGSCCIAPPKENASLAYSQADTALPTQMSLMDALFRVAMGTTPLPDNITRSLEALEPFETRKIATSILCVLAEATSRTLTILNMPADVQKGM